MDRLEIVRENALAKSQYLLLFKSPLLGQQLEVPGIGSGEVLQHEQWKMEFRFQNEKRLFSSVSTGKKFFDIPDRSDLENTLNRCKRLLDQDKTPLDLIDELIGNWSNFAEYESFYLESLAPDIVRGTARLDDKEKRIVAFLKESLTPDDFSNLPEHIKVRYHGGIPHFLSEYGFTAELIEIESVRSEFIQSLRTRAVQVIKAVVAHERKKQELNRIRKRLYKEFSSDYFHARSVFAALNEEKLLSSDDFENMKMDYVGDWFFNNMVQDDDILPDPEQTAAIASDHDNIEVVARAGSGKTATIVNRARFLIQNCGVPASSVLMLAFNKKAAEVMETRLMEAFKGDTALMPHVMTVHALAHSIVHPLEQLIYDDDRTHNETLTDTVQEVIYEKIRDLKYYSKIKALMLEHFRDDLEHIESEKLFLSKDAYLNYRRLLPYRALRGDNVKSHGEKMIADILFENQIDYRYEESILVDSGTVYKPDFTIHSSSGITYIIEYFGLAGDPDYDANMRIKQAYWAKRKNYYLISVMKEDILQGEEYLKEYLASELSAPDLAFNQMTDDEIWGLLEDDYKLYFSRAMSTFIGRCRKARFGAEELRRIVSDYQSEIPEEKGFLEIGCDIYSDYLTLIEKRHQLDFDGLMDRAIEKVNTGYTLFRRREQQGDIRNIQYILIDEYQDFSYLFDEFIHAVINHSNGAKLFCVGDDWQAINAFAGSDVKYFEEFLSRNNNANRYFISTNYRSVSNVVDASTYLMQEGDSDIQIHANTKDKGFVYTCYLNRLRPKLSEREQTKTDVVTAGVLRLVQKTLDKSGKKVVILARTNNRLPTGVRITGQYNGSQLDKFCQYIQSFFPEFERKRIRSSTVHKYKGKEEDAVIILDATAQLYPHIHPSWIFYRLFGDDIWKIIDDEMRLFYVALTRAKTDLYILTDELEESSFLQKVRESSYIEDIDWEQFPPVPAPEDILFLEVCNEPFHGYQPTISIKGFLRDKGFQYNSERKSWFQIFKSEDFNLESLLTEEWAANADHVVLKIYNCDEELERKVRLIQSDGVVKAEEMEIKEFENLASFPFLSDGILEKMNLRFHPFSD